MSGTPLKRQNPSKNPPKFLRFRGFCVQGSQKTLSNFSSSSSSSSSSSGGRPGFPSSFSAPVCRDTGLPVPAQAGAHSCACLSLSSLFCPGRPPSPLSLPPSFCPLSLSLSLSLSSLSLSLFASMHSEVITVNLVDPASSHTLVSKTKPGMSQRKRFTARLQVAR